MMGLSRFNNSHRIIQDFIFDSLQQGVNLPDYVSEGGMATKNERWTRRKSFQIFFFDSFHNHHSNTNETFLVSWASGHFCLVVGSPPDYDYDARFPPLIFHRQWWRRTKLRWKKL